MGASATLKKVQRKFKLRSLTLNREALNEVTTFLTNFSEEQEDEYLDLLLNQIEQTTLKKSVLDKEVVRPIVELLLEADAAIDTGKSCSNEGALRIVDAFLVPKLSYDPIKKTFYEYTGNLPIHGDASSKVALYRERYQLLNQRLLRNSDFSRPAFDTDITRSGGEVHTCGFPPLEDGNASLAVHTGLDFFGAGYLTPEETARLVELEKKAVNDMFVILSDVWLDNEETMEKLAAVLDGYENVEVVPSLFVFMGNFCSRPCNLAFNSYSSLRSQFAKFGEMIAAHPRLKEGSRFLFIPGPEDAGPSTVLPRCALPKYLTDELLNHVPNAIFSSNPCRIRFYTQEIVFFRRDLLYRMRRSCLIPPSKDETDDPFGHLVATITHQSHLCPLPLTVQPILWNYDHCLRLYPAPHTIVLADNCKQQVFKQEIRKNNKTLQIITCFNPGSFSCDSTFVAYRPCNQEVELSALPGPLLFCMAQPVPWKVEDPWPTLCRL
ncbi:hypothetical protein AMTR_s00024p00151000 [Amborella trichopoda]|uniref:DNA polymerase epsilon subunit n=1 Tax=Amborella trichopoda TaxID=13333 RepID=W1PTD6_AMBTC|nr:hypothetical protein AMTR_s00024p00151000 [Amborella trichopoda]